MEHALCQMCTLFPSKEKFCVYGAATNVKGEHQSLCLLFFFLEHAGELRIYILRSTCQISKEMKTF